MTISQKAQQFYYNLLTQPDGYLEWRELLLNTLFPNQFELYFIGFELVNSQNVVENRFVFPILPNSISAPDNIIQNVQKTAGGVVSQYVTGFTPNQIQIAGHFGRDFKIISNLISNKETLNSFKGNTVKEDWQKLKSFFSDTILTGFGCFNALKNIFAKSSQLDSNGKPYKTIFYNLIYSSAYYVQLMNFDTNMTFEKNRIHNYTLTMKKLQPLNSKTLLPIVGLINKISIGASLSVSTGIVKRNMRII